MIENIEQARQVAADLRQNMGETLKLLKDLRKVRDRQMADVLSTFAAVLPPRYQEFWTPSQTPEVEAEITDISQLLVSNEPSLEAVLKSTDRTLLPKAQKHEAAAEALLAQLSPVAFRQQRYDAMLGDPFCVVAVDHHGPGAALGDYAEHEDLKKYAESDEADEEGPKGKYRKAYRDEKSKPDPGDPHERAYKRVTKDAAMDDGLRVSRRVVDLATWAGEVEVKEGKPVCQVGMEEYDAALNPLISSLAGYGLKKVGSRVVCEGSAAEPMVGDRASDWTATGTIAASQSVHCIYIRTTEELCAIIEGKGEDGGAIFIRQPQPKPGKTGYYIAAAHVKPRGKLVDRFRPFMYGMIVEAQELNAAVSVAKAMAYAEAARNEYQVEGVKPGVEPLDPTRESKSTETGGGTSEPLAGEIKRVPSTDMDVPAYITYLNEAIERYRSKEFFSGSGTAGESARHLARVQTAQLTKLVPIQNVCSEQDREMIEDIFACYADAGETFYVPDRPQASEDRSRREEMQMLNMHEVTPEIARLPVQYIVTTGAETPEARYAQMQVSGEQMDRGTWGITTHRHNAGVKDPAAEEALWVEDQLAQGLIGEGLKHGLDIMRPMVEAFVASIVPQPAQEETIEEPPVDPMADPMMVDPSMVDPMAPPVADPALLDVPVPMQETEIAPGTVPDVAGNFMGV